MIWLRYWQSKGEYQDYIHNHVILFMVYSPFIEIIDLNKKGFRITLPLPPPIKGGEVEIINLKKKS